MTDNSMRSEPITNAELEARRRELKATLRELEAMQKDLEVATAAVRVKLEKERLNGAYPKAFDYEAARQTIKAFLEERLPDMIASDTVYIAL